jgi:hypothetical protein
MTADEIIALKDDKDFFRALKNVASDFRYPDDVVGELHAKATERLKKYKSDIKNSEDMINTVASEIGNLKSGLKRAETSASIFQHSLEDYGMAVTGHVFSWNFHDYCKPLPRNFLDFTYEAEAEKITDLEQVKNIKDDEEYAKALRLLAFGRITYFAEADLRELHICALKRKGDR